MRAVLGRGGRCCLLGAGHLCPCSPCALSPCLSVWLAPLCSSVSPRACRAPSFESRRNSSSSFHELVRRMQRPGRERHRSTTRDAAGRHHAYEYTICTRRARAVPASAFICATHAAQQCSRVDRRHAAADVCVSQQGEAHRRQNRLQQGTRRQAPGLWRRCCRLRLQCQLAAAPQMCAG